jgi:hypothetical protein
MGKNYNTIKNIRGEILSYILAELCGITQYTEKCGLSGFCKIM